jgi:hypothetical protein
MSDLTDKEKMGLFAHAVDVNGAKALAQRARVDEEGRLVGADADGWDDAWPVGMWLANKKMELKNPAKKAALYAMLTQNGTNEIVKANLDKFLTAYAASAAAYAAFF